MKIVHYSRVSGLYLILVTDLDGVQLLRVTPDDKSTDVASSFISSFVLSSDQAGKLGLGKHKSIISMYNNYQVSSWNF